MKSGHRQEFVSRLTTATVDMHWHASTKKTIIETATSGVHAGLPSGLFALRTASINEGDCASASLPTLYTIESVETRVSRAANEETSPMPIFQSNPSGAIKGSSTWPN